MTKLYYNKTSRRLCNRYPFDIPIDDDCDYIEVEDDIAEDTFTCIYGKSWAVVNGELVMIDAEEIQSTTEYQNTIKNNEISLLKEYLSNTDYVVAKLQEAQLEDEDEFNSLKQEYADVLAQRKRARARINELESLM